MRYKIARKLAAIDGVELQDVRSTVGPEDDANNWRKYLGRADDVLALLSSPAAEPVGWQYRWRPVYPVNPYKPEWNGWIDGKAPVMRGGSYEFEERQVYAAPVELDALRRELSVTKEISAGWQRLANTLCHERDEAVSTVKRLRGTLEYIAAQAKQDYPTVLSVIRANATAALDDDWQATVSRLSRKDTDNG